MGRHVVITGALGNLGQKLIRHLAPHPEIAALTGVDARAAPAGLAQDVTAALAARHAASDLATLEFRTSDFRDGADAGWRQAIEACDAVVHFAAQVPTPHASWDDAAASLDMTLHVGLAAVASRQCARVVFATTNHVMGRYKDEPLAAAVAAGALEPDAPYGVGTVVDIGADATDSTPYAAAKFAGERICRALARADQDQGRTEFVAVRIGWCNAGANQPSSLTPTGAPDVRPDRVPAAQQAAFARADRWFKAMWLSNRDFAHLFERALLADSRPWPASYICVNGMSNNAGMKWSLAATRAWLGYAPRDDAFARGPRPAA